MAPPRNPTPRPVQRTLPASASAAAAAKPTTSDGGWNTFTHALSRVAPRALYNAEHAVRALDRLRTRGR